MFPKINPSTTTSWANLADQSTKESSDIRSLIQDEARNQKLTHQLGDFLFDFTKNSLSTNVLNNLILLANECQLKKGIEAQFNGEAINETENRAVLHTALRSFDFSDSNGRLVQEQLKKIQHFSDQLLSGEWKGYSGKAITDVVNIGIGGSDLGPKMVTHALRDGWTNITPHFISNVDAAQLEEELQGLETESTLFIIASKTFTTQETMTNAATAKDWFLRNGGSQEDIEKHFVAVSTNKEAVVNFGIDPANMFEFWDWVGGRFSLWSSIGLITACTIGYHSFEQLLKGANEMDIHFRSAPIEQNMPILSALIGIWYNNFLGFDSYAILPYDHRLRYLPSYLQQADMESNGKSIDRNGQEVTYQTGPIIWGEPGTNGQHAFYQLIHQGTKIIPCEFIAFANPGHAHSDHHEKLLANFFAQSEALLQGKSADQVVKEMGNHPDENLVPFKTFSGNRPSSSILIKELNPYNLGKLIAYYEHKIFVQGLIWNIYSYDQWGVELGKQLAQPILAEIRAKASGDHDASTTNLMQTYFNWRK